LRLQAGLQALAA